MENTDFTQQVAEMREAEHDRQLLWFGACEQLGCPVCNA